jgi:hypothetical protein
MSNPLIRWIKRIEARQVPETIVATAATTITPAQARQGVVVSNRGATGTVTVTLPAATPGMRVSGIVQAAQLLAFDPAGTEVIFGIAGISLGAGTVIQANAAGECVQLVCTQPGVWSVASVTGVWTATGA